MFFVRGDCSWCSGCFDVNYHHHFSIVTTHNTLNDAFLLFLHPLCFLRRASPLFSSSVSLTTWGTLEVRPLCSLKRDYMRPSVSCWYLARRFRPITNSHPRRLPSSYSLHLNSNQFSQHEHHTPALTMVSNFFLPQSQFQPPIPKHNRISLFICPVSTSRTLLSYSVFLPLSPSSLFRLFVDLFLGLCPSISILFIPCGSSPSSSSLSRP
ncbi:hypothetical protein K474DRAFT_343673 [Panus rudis PR-1116 ss-1]|nr:hypothetical protein K474DRAFT_343673 [Panus rudis PR-1116 ss-1]